MKDKKAITLKTLTKSNVWDIQENDVIRMWEAAEKDADLKDNLNHYTDIIRTAFEIEEVKVDNPIVIEKLESRGFKIGVVGPEEATRKYAIKKRAIMRVTDLTYENVGHISAAKLVEILERNFGSGWESLSQSIQDIIQGAFDISTTTLPADRLHKEGGLYDKKVNDGYEVLEIPKGTWTEAIFVKEKPEIEEKTVSQEIVAPVNNGEDDSDEDSENKDPEDSGKDGNAEEEGDDSFDDDKLTEESYRTTYETNPDELNYEAEEITDDEGDSNF